MRATAGTLGVIDDPSIRGGTDWGRRVPSTKKADSTRARIPLESKFIAECAADAAPSSRGPAEVQTHCFFTKQSSVHLKPHVHGNLGEGAGVDGFSLLELLIVIAIMLIVVAIALPRITPMLQAAHKTTIVAKMRTLTNELSTYRMECSGYPESLDALKPSPEKACPRGSAAFSDPTTTPGLPAVAGYRLTYAAANRDESGHYEDYTLSAVPSSTGGADGESYFADQTGIIRVLRNGPATVSDPALVP